MANLTGFDLYVFIKAVLDIYSFVLEYWGHVKSSLDNATAHGSRLTAHSGDGDVDSNGDGNIHMIRYIM